MASFIDEIGAAVKQTACAVIATNDAINGFMESISFPGAESYRDTTRALRRQLCNNPDDVVPIPSPAFSGGQCSDVSYRVSWNAGFVGCATGVIRENIIRGAITVTGPVTRDIETIPRPADPTTADNLFKINGVTVGGLATKTPCQPNSTDGNASSVFWGLFSIIRIDGQPDDCGDPPSPIPPYVPSPVTVNIEYEDNSQITINEDVDITIFAPQVNLIGGIFAPITIAGNTFQLAGTVDLSPKFDVQISPKINIGGRGGKTDKQPSDPDGEVPEPEEDPGERRVIVGAVVTATSVSNRQDFLPQQGNPDIGIPNLGYCSFYIATNDATSWTEDIPIKSVRSYIPCPVAAGAIDVDATGRRGITLQVEPVWAYPGQQV